MHKKLGQDSVFLRFPEQNPLGEFDKNTIDKINYAVNLTNFISYIVSLF